MKKCHADFYIQKTFTLLTFILLFISPCVYAKKLAFDANGDMYYEYGERKYFDGEVVSSKEFRVIRIFSAIEMDDFAVVKEELASGIGINDSIREIHDDGDIMEYTPLIFAINNGKEEIAKSLIEMGANPDKTVKVFFNGQNFEFYPLLAAFTQFSNEKAPISIDFIMNIVKKARNLPKDCDVNVGLNYTEELLDLYFSKICELYIGDEDRQVNCLIQMMSGAMFIAFSHGESQFATESADCIEQVVNFPLVLEKRDIFLQWFKNVRSNFGAGYSGQREWQRVEAAFKFLEMKKDPRLNAKTSKNETVAHFSPVISKIIPMQAEDVIPKVVDSKSKSVKTENTTSKTSSLKSQSSVLAENKTPVVKKSESLSPENNAVKIIDASAVSGKFKDNIVIISKISESSPSIKISAISNDSFIPIGTAVLHGFDDSLKFDSSKSLRLADYKTFQLESSDGKTYTYKAEKRNNDLIIEVRENGSDLSKPAIPKWTGNTDVFSFDLKSLEDEPDENVKIFCNSLRGVGKTFKLRAYDSKQRKWILYGTVQVKKQRNDEKMKTEKGVEDLDDYRYFAIETENTNSYKFYFEEKDDDLFITVSD
ncbi:hypothetical protein [uncultured Treponema sp.]|nr:hypothetical protein [uncultured Treponema sp.]